MYCSISNFNHPLNDNIQYLMLAFYPELRFSSDSLDLLYGYREWFSLKRKKKKKKEKTIGTHSLNISLMFKECLF